MADIDTVQRICGQLDRGEIDNAQFLQAFTREVARLIGCTRAGVWVFVDTAQGRALHCAAMYDTQQARMVLATDMLNLELGPYFKTLMRDQCVVASDARSHPATLGFMDDYLLPMDVRSLMDVCFTVNGQPFGVFSCEQVGAPSVWTSRQLNTLRQIGSRASLALMHAASTTVDTAPAALFELNTTLSLGVLPPWPKPDED